MVRGDSRPAGNLPAELTSLVGRRAEAAEVRRLWSGSRLVTLTGPGGVGKTRLALQVGRTARGAFPDGVWLVALDEVTQPDLLASTVASALGEPGLAGTCNATVAGYIGAQHMLLILDNCEHVINSCAKLITELLVRCPNLRVLATSREALRIEGEALYAVPPLSLPGPGQQVAPGEAARFDAVELFLERALALNPRFTFSAADEQCVIALCERLDGLPLAIELAAAGTRLLPLGALADWAKAPPSEQVFGGRTAPSRHQTLRATMDYSYRLCSPHAQTLWARFSVFRGGADLDAVEAVCGGNVLPPQQVRPALVELIDKSVVVFDGFSYRMLETIRQFGLEHLRAAGEEDVIRRAHRDQVAALAVEVEGGWFGPDQQALLRRVRTDQANLRAALEFCLTERAEAGAGLRLASALWAFWLGCGVPGEGRRWLDRLLAADDRPTRERVTALWVNGCLTAMDGDIPAGLALFEQCQRLAARFQDQAGLAHALSQQGLAKLYAGRSEDAITDLEEAVRRERGLGQPNPYLAEALVDLGVALCYRDRLDRAVEVLQEARLLCSAHREQWLQSWALVFLGLAALIDERVPEAVALIKDALRRKRTLEDGMGMAHAVEILAWAALADHDEERAARLLAASEVLSRPVGPHLYGHHRLLQWRDHYLQQARDILGPRAFEEAAQFGRHLASDDVIAYALGEKPAPASVAVEPSANLPLTPREHEIAHLVAVGRTNKDIAAELVISRRTAEAHVQNILTKLGFSSRTEIAALFSAMSKASP
ncbi:LuxR C-terminal-related transcriptional regulator [Saccharopolyspora shandongensis]|uniref:ATP-binding protein n=1 Tax=Saccharopolyspora shandongensis TaxID=418495 RepID=UPI003436C2B1